MGKNPDVTSPVFVWWLHLIAKGIVISNKIGRSRKDRAAGGGRDEGEVPKAGPRRGRSDPAQCRAFAGASPARRRRRREQRRGERRVAWGRGRRGRAARRGSREISWAPRQERALGASLRLGEAFIPGSERPAADCGAGEQLDYC